MISFIMLVFSIISDNLPIIVSSRLRNTDGLLEITNLKLGDKGSYMCEASNTIGRIIKTVKVYLNGTYIIW